jgi:hypothetical protein
MGVRTGPRRKVPRLTDREGSSYEHSRETGLGVHVSTGLRREVSISTHLEGFVPWASYMLYE